jgi:DNA-binding NarL/FixJ family response regulator
VHLETKPDRQPLRPVERACADLRPATTQAKVSSICRSHMSDVSQAATHSARTAQIMVPPPPKASQDTRLTERQIDVLRELSQGKTNKLIARELGISEGTVKIHLAAIFRALCVQNRTEAAIMARQLVGSRDSSPDYPEVKSA